MRAVGPERTIATDREGGKPQAEKRGKQRIEKEEEEEERGTRMGKGSSHGGAKEEEEEEEGKLRERDRRGKFGFSSLFALSLYPPPPLFVFRKKEVVGWTWSRRERVEGKRQGAIEGEKFRTDVVDTEERETGVSKEEEKRGVAVLGGLPLGRK